MKKAINISECFIAKRIRGLYDFQFSRTIRKSCNVLQDSVEFVISDGIHTSPVIECITQNLAIPFDIYTPYTWCYSYVFHNGCLDFIYNSPNVPHGLRLKLVLPQEPEFTEVPTYPTLIYFSEITNAHRVKFRTHFNSTKP